MKGNVNHIGVFEGFNFRNQQAIDRLVTAEEVLAWDHDAKGEAEFWPDGSNPFVSKLLSRCTCTAEEVREVMRILDELDGEPVQLAKAIYLKDRGLSLEEIGRHAVEESSLYVYGPGWFIDLEKRAAYELFELFWPEAYAFWEKNTVPGLIFDVENFMQHFATFELKLSEGGYLIVDTE